VCPQLSSQQIDINAKMRVCFEINASKNNFEGALLFKLQKHSDIKYNMDTLITETNKNKATHFNMLVAWKVKNSKPFIHIALVEHVQEFTWNEDSLKKLYDKNRGWLKRYNSTTSYAWLMDNSMALKMITRIRGIKESFELSIYISEEEKDDYAMRPLCVDLER
jgi:hypothetical protein